MSPQCDVSFSPGQQNIGMMSLLLGQRSCAIHEIQCLLEVGETILAMYVMFSLDLPLRDAFVQLFEFLSLERRDFASAGHAFFVGKFFGHEGLQI
jgi:hypothetical protein